MQIIYRGIKGGIKLQADENFCGLSFLLDNDFEFQNDLVARLFEKYFTKDVKKNYIIVECLNSSKPWDKDANFITNVKNF